PGAAPALTRRRLLRAGGTAAVALTGSWAAARAFDPGTEGTTDAAADNPGDPYDTLRQRWRELLTGTGFDATAAPYDRTLTALGTRAAAALDTMAPAAGTLWPDLPLGTASANITAGYVRLRTLALAWAQPGTGHTGDPALAAAVATGLDHLHTHAFTPTATAYGNWWDWQIGAPQALLDTVVLLHDRLTAEQVAAYCAAVDRSVPDDKVAVYAETSTGANRVDLCRVLAVRGVLGRSAAKLATASAALSPVFPYVLAGDGLYADGSFVQHTSVPYTGSYGEVLLGGLSRLLGLLAGSPWEVTDPLRQNVFDAVTRAYAPFVFNGLAMDAVAGRAVSRGSQSSDQRHLQQDDHTRGHALMSHILRLADSGAAPAGQSAGWRAMVKGWIARDGYRPYLADGYVDVPELARAERLLADRSMTGSPEPAGAVVFGMDRAVVRRAGWAASLSLCSARTSFYETGNGEHLRGWHSNSGMLSWWGSSFGNGQYSDAFWPTVDPYRLPGTTVSAKRLADAEGGAWGEARPDSLWAGGACDGTYAAVGQDLRGLSSTLRGRASWFLLDDAVVCLGAGISCADGAAVRTVVDNRNLGAAGTPALTVDGVAQPGTPGRGDRFPAARWMALAGAGAYLFPDGAAVDALREARTGSWHDINGGGATDPLTRHYLTLWIDHGTDPAGAGYHYQLMPGADAAAAAARSAAPTVTVLANSASVQAVSDSTSGVTAANFFAAGTAGPITVSAPSSVLLRERDGTLTVTVCDPSRTAATVHVTVARSGWRSAEPGPGVSVLGLGEAVTLLVETGGAQGASRTVTLRTAGSAAPPARVALVPAARDAYLRDGPYGDSNYGTATTLTVKSTGTPGSGFDRRALFGFDVPALAGEVRRAVLWVHGAVADTDGTQTALQCFAASGGWTETAVTWNRSPALGPALGSGAISTTADWIGLDVTAAVAGVPGPLSLALWQPSGRPGLAVDLDGREHPAFAPFLQLVTD
uniref:polysaccharide lyase family 8 super-sandwich domain-containing protein n=1 Tax=Kitasatospora sp. MBT63 TaxID=1444768 RepID=UPI0007C703DD